MLQFEYDPRDGEIRAMVEFPLEDSRRHDLKPGQLVCWKPELKNRKYPAYGECGVVVSVLPEPVMDAGRDSGCPYFREPLDIVLGFLDGDGDFITYHFDSRRFAPVVERAPDATSS